MKRRIAIGAVALLAVAYLAFGASVRAARAPRVPPPPGEIRGAYHVHTVRSDGRGSLDEVVRAAREAGLQFVVVTDHNALAPEDQGYREGVLVVEATEASTPFGHVVALGVPRALTAEERAGDPLAAISALGGEAVLAHPLHPRRPFTGWGRGPWRGFELVSNDAAWHEVVARREWWRAVRAALVLPFDGGRAVALLAGDVGDERARFDAEVRRARASGARRAPVLLCSADAHGYPSYRAAFEAFSMHLPVALTGDAKRDAAAVVAALEGGRASCVFDGVAPAGAVALSVARAGERRALELSLEAPDLSGAGFTLLRDGAQAGSAPAPARSGPVELRFECGGTGCGPGDYRVEGTWRGRPWIFTNPVSIE